MKALSIRQPWAWLVAQGFKDIENRCWQTSYRGLFLIHAAKAWGPDERDDLEFAKELATEAGLVIPWPAKFECGAIVGVATIVDCVAASPSPWFGGPFGFVVKEARAIEPVTCRGMLNFFTPNVPFGVEERWR
jgi:hypothetical protein